MAQPPPIEQAAPPRTHRSHVSTPGASQVEARRVALLVLAQMSGHLRDEVRTPLVLVEGWRASA